MARKRASAPKRQTKISFSPTAKSSPAKTTPAKAMGSRPKRQSKIDIHNIAPKGTPRRATKQTPTYESSDDELQVEEDSVRVGLPVRAKSNGVFGSSDVDIASEAGSSESQSDAEKTVKLKASRASGKRQRVDSSDDDEPTVTVIQRKRARQAESEEEEEELRLPGKRRRVERRQTTPEESEEATRTPPRSTRRRLAKRTATPEEEEHQSPPKSTRRRARRPRASSDEDDGEEEVQAADSGAESGNNEEQDELREELAFLQSSPLRITHDKPKSKRQEALDALRRKRAGSTQEPSSTPARKTRIVVESESDSELEVIKEEPDSDEAGDPESAPEEDEEGDESERDANALDMFQEDEDDTGFIDDDPDAVIGEPDVDQAQLPMQFSSMSRAKPRELFKYAVEWMVMKKIHPAFNPADEIYELTFRKLGDEVKALASSKFTSSAWTPDFTKAINARPELFITEIAGSRRAFLSDHCEACNRKNHPATFELSLTGAPYNPSTLEPLEPDSDSDSSAASDSSRASSPLSDDPPPVLPGDREPPAYDARGDLIPPASKVFTLGSTCKANAQVAHTLHHWRFHLNEWVRGYLESNGFLAPERLVKRDRKSDRKREREARRIVDGMERKGEIRKLHRLYKEQVSFALEAQNEYRMGWGRR